MGVVGSRGLEPLDASPLFRSRAVYSRLGRKEPGARPRIRTATCAAVGLGEQNDATGPIRTDTARGLKPLPPTNWATRAMMADCIATLPTVRAGGRGIGPRQPCGWPRLSKAAPYLSVNHPHVWRRAEGSNPTPRGAHSLSRRVAGHSSGALHDHVHGCAVVPRAGFEPATSAF